ncbi:hypothetical protein FQR65_LT04417 [Abscondita terminalis]|nr:hypothetical protein FQR65_LT04417 [Abscondita terminalis]
MYFFSILDHTVYLTVIGIIITVTVAATTWFSSKKINLIMEGKEKRTNKKQNQYNQKKKHSKKNVHRARLVVRNLPFATTEENLLEHFKKFGEIEEIKLLKREDGTVLGCGFVQYQLVQKAAKARHHLNGKPFLDRNIECDWALPKDKYQKEQNDYDQVRIKQEPVNDGYEVKLEIQDVNKIKEEFKHEVKYCIEDKETLENGVEDDEQESKEYSSAEEVDDNFSENNEATEHKSKVVSDDIVEGKTVFIKNIPFAATSEDLKISMSKFGSICYAVICIDELTEHSRGTAFVKFKKREDADRCLGEKGIKLMGNTIECERALSREEIKNKSIQKIKGPRDSRNLYLVKEGVILAGSKAAENVSAADMAKRLQVEQYKTQMLRNLNMFVARTRLVVHNIPSTWTDMQLKALFEKYSGPNATIKEARVMRNMRSLDANGIGKSKEYGFVTFTTHESALHALRSLNNNPNIFNANKRPIIAFSIENKSKLQAKEKRLINSKLKNPHSKSYDPKAASFHTRKNKNNSYTNNYKQETTDEVLHKFSGVKASYGNNKMKNKFNLRAQAQVHFDQIKKDKKRRKLTVAKEPLKQKQKILKSTKKNFKKFKNDDNFSKLVNNYKQKLSNAENRGLEKWKKWYE